MDNDPAPSRDTVTTVVNHSGLPLPNDVFAWPGIRVVECERHGAIPSTVQGEVVLTRTDGGPNLAELLARGARWVHTVGTGVDAFPFDALSGQVLTCARGVSGELIGEWAFAQMIAFAKAVREAPLDAAPDDWHAPDRRISSLRGKTLVVFGVGGIGAEVARLSLALGMRVIGVRRRGTDAPHAGMEIVNDLSAVVGEADHLVLAAPATAETAGLVGDALLDAVRPGLHLVNVARGTLVDQDALRRALDDGRVAQASLDVCDPEPLPAGHWLFDHPQVFLTPHTSWAGPGAFAQIIATFHANYLRWRAGEPLDGVVDIDAGY